MDQILAISNEGWDALCFSVLFICIAVVIILGMWLTGRYPWEGRDHDHD